MKTKKKSKSKKRSATVLHPDQEILIADLLTNLKQQTPENIVHKLSDPSTACSFLDRMPAAGHHVFPVLKAMAGAFDDKSVQKAIKRTLYRLKNRGIETEEDLFSSASPAFRPIQKEPPLCQIGPIDTLGSRAVVLHLFTGGRGMDVAMGMISDEKGLEQFVFDHMSRKRARELENELSSMAGPLVQTSLSHVTFLLENAHRTGSDQPSTSTSDYLNLRPWLLEQKTTGEPDFKKHLGKEFPEIKVPTETQLETLFEHKLIYSWHAPFEPLKPFMEKIQGVDSSPIILNDTQKQNRFQDIIDQCAQTLFPESKKEVFIRRLKEMAFFFLKINERLYAEICYGAATGIHEQNSRFCRQEILAFFVERSIRFYFELGGETADDTTEMAEDVTTETPSGILLPYT
jgi:hypothetical protein